MKIHAYILCYNEEEIIRSTLDYYRQFCSRIFLMDNMSTDKTLEFANRYEEVTVIPWVDETIDQRLLIKMKSKTYREYSREGGRHTQEIADWIISCDADEILYHPDIVSILAKYQEQGITVPQITGFNMVDEAHVDPDRLLTEQYRRGIRAPHMDKRVVFGSNFDMHYSWGAHPRGPGFELMQEEYNYRPSATAELALLHFKHIGNRSYNIAKTNLVKAPLADGDFIGAPPHYKAALEGLYDLQKQYPERPFVIGDDGHIAFDSFISTTGEAGDQISMRDVRGKFAEILRNTATTLEKRSLETNIDECIALMSVASKFRPNGEFIREKLNHYQNHKSQLRRQSFFTRLKTKLRAAR